MKINVGLLVSYDYELLKHSLPRVYDDADSITLAIDENLNTWSCEKFTIDPAFFTWLEQFDSKKKIRIYRDNFYDPNLNAIQNDTRERNMLAKEMGEGWNIQVDADEYFIDFKSFANYLRKNKFAQKKPTQICPFSITLFKRLDDGILYIKQPDPFTTGSNLPQYTSARKSKKQMKLYVPFLLLHQSWARTEEELDRKLRNWGHNVDFDINDYVNFWKNLNKDNYHTAINFHPLSPRAWNKLDFCPGSTIEEVLENLKKDLPKIDKFRIFKKNLGQRIKHARFF